MPKHPEVIILRETALQSWISDMSSVVGFVLLIGIGIYLDSTVMQFCGGILGFLTIVVKATRAGKDGRMSIVEARKRLDEIESEKA